MDVKYKKLTQIEHILKRPGMYIGGVNIIEENRWILSSGVGLGSAKESVVKYPPGFYKIFDELIVNVYDQTIRDKTMETIKIDIDQKNNMISVFNDGRGISVTKHPTEKIYIPELIFGHLLTSSTFDDTEDKPRVTGGVHGLGAKLTAIFSTYFKVEIGDSKNKKSFSQIYTNNLSKKSDPIISNYSGSKGYVKISYKPDLKYFKMERINNNLFALLKRRAYDLGGLINENIDVFINEKRVKAKNFSNYVKIYTDEPQIKHYCAKTTGEYEGFRWRIIFTKSSDGFKQISFVNGINTSHGGFHVSYIMNNLVKQLKEIIKQRLKTNLIKDSFIKDQFAIFMACVIENPEFPSQTKDNLITPVNKFGSICELPSDFVKKMYKKFELENVFRQYIQTIQNVGLAKLNIKKKNTIKGIPKLNDANYAGTKNSHLATLILTEGDSAKAMAISGLSVIPKSSDTFGVFPLKGKLLNVREASHKQIMQNQEFINLRKIIGLSTGVQYTEDNIGSLRYGSILLMMDADVDGSHIKGLFINMIEYFFPSLLKIDGFIKMFITPVVKVTNKRTKESKSFYALEKYNEWKKTNNQSGGWTIKYYKGLGTNTSEEAKSYFKNLDKHIINISYDENTIPSIHLAFSKKEIGNRKKWLQKYDKTVKLNYEKEVTFDGFINKELIHFSNYDNVRSIPNLLDGFKPSQRKVIYSCFKRNLTNEIKVAQLVGYVSEHSSYHHGEASLASTIISMAQNFVGSNNINFLVPKGQFGCVDPDTNILMWDGTTKLAKKIEVGDKLVGDDGTPRIVSKTISGRDIMYKIKNGKMTDYIVNQNHILTLSFSKHKSIVWDEMNKMWTIYYFDDELKTTIKKNFRARYSSPIDKCREVLEFSEGIPDGHIFDVTVQEYLGLPKWGKKLMRGVINSSIIDWQNDFEISVQFPENISDLKLPDDIITQFPETRIKYLGKIIDMYGNLNKESNKYIIYGKNGKISLLDKIRVMSGSLGFKSAIRKNKHGIFVTISGSNIDKIPTRHKEDAISDSSTYFNKIKVTKLGEGPFCGWNIDKNERFLMADFTVTHNTRILGGKDHSSPRYIYTLLEKISRIIFNPLDDKLLNYLDDDGFTIEPEYYLPIIPTVLVNGTQGIGTGYSTFVPKYNPNDIIDELLKKLDGQKIRELTPWYNNFEGNIARFDNYSYLTLGKYKMNGNILTIYELPIGEWTEKYKIFIGELAAKNKIIKSVKDNSTDAKVEFIVKFISDKALQNLSKGQIMKNFKLTGKLSVNNMYLYDKNHKLKKYDTTKQIMEEFYEMRMDFYVRRKKYLLEKLEKELKILESKAKFIDSVISKKIQIMGKTKSEIINILDKNKFYKLEGNYDYLINMSFYNLTKEKINELNKLLKSKREEYLSIKNKTPVDMWKDELKGLKQLLNSK